MDPVTLANRRGIRFMTLAMSFFVVNDALVKFISQSLPAGQLIMIRGVIACVLILAVARALRVPVRAAHLRDRWVLLRASLEAIGSIFYLYALFHIPLPNASAINLSSPLFIAVLAMIFYKERVDAARWLAIAVGFGGVLLVIQPRANDFNAFALLTLAGTVMYSGRDLLTRRIPKGIDALVVTLSTSMLVTLLAGAILLLQGWQPMSARQFGLLALAAVFLASGYYFIIQASRQGDFSVVAPFRYVGLLGALLLGYLVWGDVPNALAWAGIALLVAAGWSMLLRENRRLSPAR